MGDNAPIVVGGVLLAVVIALMALGSWFTVQPGNVAIKTRMGKIVGAYGTGLHFKLPVIESIDKFSTLVQKAEIKTQSFSKDLQTLDVVMAVNYRIQEDTVIDIYSNLGLNYLQTVVDPTVQETLKSITAKHSAEEIIANRPAVVAELNDIAQKRLLNNKIIVTQIVIQDMSFSKEFLDAVEQKQIAEQDTKKAEKLVLMRKMEMEQKVIMAKGEAEALRMQREQVTPQMIELRKVEAQIKAIEKWDGNLPTYVGGAVPFINAGSISK